MVEESLHEFSSYMHVSSGNDGDRTLHVARLDVPRKLDRFDGGARKTLRTVGGLALAAQSCREEDSAKSKICVLFMNTRKMVIWAQFADFLFCCVHEHGD